MTAGSSDAGREAGRALRSAVPAASGIDPHDVTGAEGYVYSAFVRAIEPAVG